MKHYSVIPQRWRVLSNSALKVIAVVTMLIDHVASVFLRGSGIVLLSVFGHKLMLYTLMRFIGRLAFPIFAFLLVEGFLHTSNRKKYGIRLFLFALISEVPWDLEHFAIPFHFLSQNVFFTLLLGYLGLCVCEKLEQGHDKKKYIPMLFGLLALSAVSFADYRGYGFGFILLIWLLRDYPIIRAVVGSCILPKWWKAGLAFIPIGMYNGKRGFIKGKVLQIAFYIIYPAHMLAFYLIKNAMGGYS